MESITDELRKWAKGSTLSSWTAEHLTAIADHIDAELAERYVKLPVDADGEVWHVGDFAVGEVNPKNPKAIERMIWYGPDSGWQLETNTIIYPCPDRPRHHHALTVEDVFTEFAYKLLNHDQTDAMPNRVKRLAKEYADMMHAIIEGSKGPEWQETDSQDEGR